MNMSYCRFENTYRDLCDCEEHMNDTDLSESEKKFRRRIIEECLGIVQQYDVEED